MKIWNGGQTAYHGTVRFWNSSKGYGFIRPDHDGDDIFCHINGTRLQQELSRGTRVRYYVLPDRLDPSKLMASDTTVLT